MPGRAQSTLLAQELMEEEWNAWHSMESCPEALAQVRLGCVSPIYSQTYSQDSPIYCLFPPYTLKPTVGILTAFNPVSSTFTLVCFRLMVPKYQTVDLLHHCIIFNYETEKKVMLLLGYSLDVLMQWSWS